MASKKFQEETTLFRSLLGDTPKIRVLEYLLEGRELDHSIQDIAEGAGINRVTLFRMWDEIKKCGIVAHTRNIGNAKLYKLNVNHPNVKILTDLFDKTINAGLKEKMLVSTR
ncbi:MAG: hypothetical protein AABX70_01680 [Nanoarchaeota archaeon]